MAIARENHRVIDSVLSKSDRNIVETETLEVYMEPFEFEQADTDGLSEETLGLEHTHGLQMSNDAAEHSEQAELESVGEDPTDGNQEGFDPTSDDSIYLELAVAFRALKEDKETVGSKLVDQGPVISEMTISEIDGSEYAALHPVGVNTQPNATVAAEYAIQHQTSSGFNSEYVDPEQERTQFVSSQSHDHETHPVMYVTGNEFIKTEYDENPDLQHQLQMSSELYIDLPDENPDLYGSEFDSAPTVRSDMANKQPVVTTTGMANSETRSTKRRKKQSIVWDHFKVETVDDGTRRAFCNVCRKSFAYGNGSKVNGTSHLKRHIPEGFCPSLIGQREKKQITPHVAETSKLGTKRRYKTPNNASHLVFDQDRCRHEIAKMVIMHDYPLQMVEHPGFVAFVQNLQPRFEMVTFNTVQGDCVATYMTEKQFLQKLIDEIPGRICLSLDMWSSCQTTGYAVIHGHFVDHEYTLHRRLLNVLMEPLLDSDTALSHAVSTCLSHWNLDNKLCSITFNQPISDASRENMRGLLSVNNPTILNGQLLLGSCLARTLSSMAHDVLEAGQDVVRKIRSSVIYLKSSNAHEQNFLELKEKLQVPSEKTLTLDNITRWETTYDMLVAACELKQVFSCLDIPNYENPPTMVDWMQAENMCMYLKLIFETIIFLAEKIPLSSDVFFNEVLKIEEELMRNATSEDHFVSSVAGLLQEKFLKYWRDSFLILAVAVAMDPRFKMIFVEFRFRKVFGEEAPAYIKMAEDAIHGLFNEYMSLTPTHIESGNQLSNVVSCNGLTDFDMYVKETASQQMKSELDQYLEESPLARQKINLIEWWKDNRSKYPTLSKMAFDVLSIPFSSVGPDYVFDTVSREMDEYRSSLRPETMEALMCAKDWLSHSESQGM